MKITNDLKFLWVKKHMNNKFKLTILFFGAMLVSMGASHSAVGRSEPKQEKCCSEQSIALRSMDEKTQNALSTVSGRLASVEGAISKASERADNDRVRSSWFALLTVIASGILGVIGGLMVQSFVMSKQRAINRDQAAAEVSNSYVEWQLKQLSELYGPLRAMLGQSNAMYLQMNRALAAAASDKFRMKQEAGAEIDDRVFEIFKNDQWVRFRTVQHLGDVYGKSYGVEPYFDDVVEVGARMAELIREKAGYVQPSDKRLIEVMGSYLAHYAVLSRLHRRAKADEPLHITVADEQATFPDEIQVLVNVGFNGINSEILNWKNQGSSLQ